MLRIAGSRLSNSPPRSGLVLYIVLILLALLSLAAYQFSESMLVEVESSRHFGRLAQLRACADSGAEYAAAQIDTLEPLQLHVDENRFRDRMLINSATASHRCRFTICSLDDHADARQRVRYGPTDETTRLNVNLLRTIDQRIAKQLLLALPEMNEQIADAILDWLDEDDKPRDYGAEADDYRALGSLSMPRNGPIKSLSELLKVRGVTPRLLFGEDGNGNGLLDPSENDGADSPPDDNADGRLDAGWTAYLTVRSLEDNRQPDGRPKIFLNDSNLKRLHKQLTTEFGSHIADFVVAYRVHGPKSAEKMTGKNTHSHLRNVSDSKLQKDEQESPAFEEEDLSPSDFPARTTGAVAGQKKSGSPVGNDTMGGIDVSAGGKFRVQSLFDLVGIEVEARIGGVLTEFASPWPADRAQLKNYLGELNKISVYEQKRITGRINLHFTPVALLAALPGMDAEGVDRIVDARTQLSQSDFARITDELKTPIWLYLHEVIDLEVLRKIGPYVTTRGQVYSMIILARFDNPGRYHQVEVVIDATRRPARIVEKRDISHRVAASPLVRRGK